MSQAEWNYNMNEAPRDGTRILVSYIGRTGPRQIVIYWNNTYWKAGELWDGGTLVEAVLKRPPYAWMFIPEPATPRVEVK